MRNAWSKKWCKNDEKDETLREWYWKGVVPAPILTVGDITKRLWHCWKTKHFITFSLFPKCLKQDFESILVRFFVDFDSFWHPLASFWDPLPPFWRPLATFGSFSRRLASILGPFWRPLPPFGHPLESKREPQRSKRDPERNQAEPNWGHSEPKGSQSTTTPQKSHHRWRQWHQKRPKGPKTKPLWNPNGAKRSIPVRGMN